MFGYYDRCFLAKQVPLENSFFQKFCERRGKFRFLIKKGAVGKNEVTRDLSSSVREIFNGYDVIKQDLGRKEQSDFTAINVVYDPEYDESVPVPCFCTGKTHIVYGSYIGEVRKGNESGYHQLVRHCPYCENLFAKSKSKTHTNLRRERGHCLFF